MRNSGNKQAVPESVMSNNDKQTVIQLPQCHKGMNWEQVKEFLDEAMIQFRRLEDMSDLNSLYQVGKQVSRLYFDMSTYRYEASELLILHEFPLYSTKMMKKLNNLGVFKNDDIWFSSFYFYNVSWNFSDCNSHYAASLANAGLPHLLCLNIAHQPYLDNVGSKNVYYLIKASLSILHNIVRVCGHSHHVNNDSVRRSIIQLANREEEFIRCVASLTLAYVLNSSTSSSATVGGEELKLNPILLDQQSAADNIANNSALLLIAGHLIHCLDIALKAEKRRHSGFTVEDFLLALSALTASVDWLKSQWSRLEQNKFIPLLKSLCVTTRQQEMELATRILWNLILDKTCCSQLKEEYNLEEFLESIQEFNTKGNVNACLWLLKSNTTTTSTPNPTPTILSPPDEVDADVYLSYAPFNKEQVDLLGKKLQNDFNLNVLWLNENNYKMEDLLKLLSRGRLTVLCLSDAFRLHPRCRMELQLIQQVLHRTDDRILPVVIQHKYKPDSWLTNALATIINNNNQKHLYDVSGRRDFDNNVEQLAIYIKEKLTGQISASSAGGGGAVGGDDHGNVNNTTTPTATSGGALGISGTSSARISRRNSGEQPMGVSLSIASSPPLATSGGGGGDGGDKITKEDHQRRSTSSNKNRISVSQWSTQDVAAWLETQTLAHVVHEFRSMDGRLLAQLLRLRRESPEFFYQSLDTKLRLSLVDILKFCASLDTLTDSNCDDNNK